MINYILLKLASRCNFDCSYCYWFRDESVRKLPKIMSSQVQSAFLRRLEEHIQTNCLTDFTCSFHGGEPTLFGVDRLKYLIQQIDNVAHRTGCSIKYAITTNGSLLDSQWIRLISEHQIAVAVSIDGPRHIHDRRRKTTTGKATWKESVSGYLLLCRNGIKPSILTVCDPLSSAENVLDFLVDDLGVMYCDVLMPDADHESKVESIAPYYIELFDCWYDKHLDRGIHVRILGDLTRGLLGLETETDSIGFAPVTTVCLNPEGRIEPHDVLRIAGEERVSTNCSIFTNALSDIEKDPLWLHVREASTSLCGVCEECNYRACCGGGHIAQRWSKLNGYHNPSVYCDDLKAIFDHIAKRLAYDITLNTDGIPVDNQAIMYALTSGNQKLLFT